VRQLAELIWGLCGREEPLQLSHVTPLTHDIQTRVPDTSQIDRMLGWRPKVQLEEGLRRTTSWLRETAATELPA
jgi:dTDP-glucose 4,6-dehydratase